MLPGPRRHDPDGPGHPRERTCSSARRRCSTSARRWATAPSSATTPSLHADRLCRRVSAGTGPRGSAPRRTTRGRDEVLRHIGDGSATRSLQLLNLVLLVCVPLAFGAGPSLLGEVPWLAAPCSGRAVGLHELGVLRGRAGPAAVLFFGSKILALLVVFTVPRLLEPGDRAGPGLPAVRLPLLGVHKAIVRLSNRKFFARDVRRQFLHRPLRPRPSATGSRPLVQTGSNFGIEVKHENPYLCSVGSGTVVAQAGTRSSTPTTRGRPSGWPGPRSGRTISSATTSSTRRRGGPARLPARHEGPGPRSTGRSGRASACWARRASRSRARSPATARSPRSHTGPTSRAAARRQEPAQPRHDRLAPAGALGLRLRRARPAVSPPTDLYDRYGAWADRREPTCSSSSSASFYLVLLERAYDRLPKPEAGRAARSTTQFWRHGAVLEDARVGYLRCFNGTTVQERCTAGCSACGSAGGSSTTAAPSPEKNVRDHRRRRAPSTPEASSSAIRRRTARSSPIAPRSAPAAPSASARSSITA